MRIDHRHGGTMAHVIAPPHIRLGAHRDGIKAFNALPRLHERYLIYLVPFFLVALFVALGLRRARLPRSRLLVGFAAASALLPALIPFGTVINGTTNIDSFALHVFSTTRSGGTVPIAHATTLAVALSALLALVYLLAASRRLPPPAAVLVTALAFLGMSTLELGSQLTPIARSELGLPAHADWVDRVVGDRANVSLVGGGAVRTVALRETAFWNASIARIYYTCNAAFGGDFGELPLVAGSAVRTRYAVVPASSGVSGRVLARDPEGKLALVAPADGTLKPSTLRCRS